MSEKHKFVNCLYMRQLIIMRPVVKCKLLIMTRLHKVRAVKREHALCISN